MKKDFFAFKFKYYTMLETLMVLVHRRILVYNTGIRDIIGMSVTVSEY